MVPSLYLSSHVFPKFYVYVCWFWVCVYFVHTTQVCIFGYWIVGPDCNLYKDHTRGGAGLPVLLAVVGAFVLQASAVRLGRVYVLKNVTLSRMGEIPVWAGCSKTTHFGCDKLPIPPALELCISSRATTMIICMSNNIVYQTSDRRRIIMHMLSFSVS